MGDVIYFPNAAGSGRALCNEGDLTAAEVKRLESIRDNVEALLNMVAGIRRDPEAVAYAAARFGLMRMYHLHGRAAAMGFADRCIETAEIAQDLDRV
jgi:predicted component of type VI protein secretion system|tara:strand:- start:85 stop:375 length:291 start_codon:yes stop_codon:yes gene_type:complete